MNLSESNFSVCFQYLFSKLSSSSNKNLIKQAKKYIIDSKNLSEKLLSKGNYAVCEELLESANKILIMLKKICKWDKEIMEVEMAIYQQLGTLYKIIKSDNKGYICLKWN